MNNTDRTVTTSTAPPPPDDPRWQQFARRLEEHFSEHPDDWYFERVLPAMLSRGRARRKRGDSW